MVSGYCYFVVVGNVQPWISGVCSSSIDESGVVTVMGVDENVNSGVGIDADSHQSSDGVVGVLGVSGGVGTGVGSHQSSDEVAGVVRSGDEVVGDVGGGNEVVGVAGADEGVVIVDDIVEIVGVCGRGVVGRLGTLHPRKSLTLFILW